MSDDERLAFLKDYLFGSKARWCVSDEEVCWFYDPADFTGEDDGGGVRADGVLMSELGEYF